MQVVSACAGNAPHATPMPPARLTQEPVVEAEAVPKETPAAEAPADASQSPLDDLLNQWMTPGNGLCDAPGAVLLVDSPTGRYLKAAGVTSLEDPRPVRVDDRFEIGSNTKAFTVILALQLQDQGVLSMDDPLSKWLPELAAQIPNGDQVTLRQMAGNTSGIWDYADPLMQPMVDANDQEGLAQLSNRARVCTARSRRYVPPIRVWDVPLRVRMTVGTENLEVGGETRDERQCVVQPINR